MKLCVMGLWHLGCVTAACMAKLGAEVIGITENQEEADMLNAGHAPIYEPDLDNLLKDNLNRGNLIFTSDMEAVISKSQYIWVCYDTPVDEEDNADEEYVINRICAIAELLKNNQGILISSQLPVGSAKKLEDIFCEKKKNPYIAYVPENLRLGKAIDIFLRPDRIIVGVRDEKSKDYFKCLIEMISTDIVWMSSESAEMTKHALNSFLATSIVFINEIASICELTGADADEVSKGLLSERRIGPGAYLKPGNAFSGGTLARDIKYLIRRAEEYGVDIPQVKGTMESNDYHKAWTYHKIKEITKNLTGKKLLVLGLTYKAGTNTLRRSLSVELIDKLEKENALITAYDPDITEQPGDKAGNWILADRFPENLDFFDCVVIMSNKEECLNNNFLREIKERIYIPLIDQNGYLRDMFSGKRTNYYTIGRGGVL